LLPGRDALVAAPVAVSALPHPYLWVPDGARVLTFHPERGIVYVSPHRFRRHDCVAPVESELVRWARLMDDMFGGDDFASREWRRHGVMREHPFAYYDTHKT